MHVRRALANLLLSLLVLATLTWGGCISCEQYFMWPGVKSCCTPNGHCKTKTPRSSQTARNCKQMAFEHQKSIDFHVDLPLISIVASDLQSQTFEPFTGFAGLRPVAPSPPDLQVLHSTFLI